MVVSGSFCIEMKKFSTIILLCVFCCISELCAQNSIEIKLVDNSNGDPVIGASTTNNEIGFQTISNNEGKIFVKAQFSDSLQICIRHVSYQPKTIWINSNTKNRIVFLQALLVQLDKINVSAKVKKQKLHPIGSIFIGAEEINELPSSFGEVDVLKVMETQTGVIRTNELNPALNVRGGSGGHNSFLIDGQPIFNPNHLLGILSTFNADLIANASMIKDGFHPSLGGSLSSFVQINNRYGNKNEYKGKIGIGLLSSRFMIEGPIEKKKSSFLFGARRSYFDLFSKTYNNVNENKKGFSPLPEYQFHDYNLKLHARINEKWFHELQLFRSYDFLDLLKGKNSKRLKTNWDNQFVSWHLKYYSKEKFKLHFLTGYGSYHFKLRREYFNSLSMRNTTSTWNNKLDLQYNFNQSLHVQWGFFFDLNRFYYKNKEEETEILLKEYDSKNKATYFGAYGNIYIKILNNLYTDIGGRINCWGRSKKLRTFSPRFVLKLIPNEKISYNLTYATTYQYKHLLSTYGMNLPNDIWYPSNSEVPAEKARQFAFGIRRSIMNKITLSTSLYYKKMNNVIDYRQGGDLLFDRIEKQIAFGKGASKGFEVEFTWKSQMWNTKVHYTYSDTWRQFNEVNKGKKFKPPFDIRHNLCLSFATKLNKRLSISASWKFASGQYTTFPSGVMLLQGTASNIAYNKIIPLYADRYNVKMKPTHRLDLALRYFKRHKKGSSQFSFGIYNVYNKSNPYFVYFEALKNEDGSRQVVARQKSLIPFLPTINYTYEF
jgi:hypothetical protein